MSALLDALRTFRTADDPWADGYQTRMADATTTLLTTVTALAETGDPDAIRLLCTLPPTNDTDGVRATVYAEIIRLEADAAGTPPPGVETAWCPTCRRRRIVEDVDNTCTTYRGDYAYEWTATHLACGHTIEGPERIVGASPGGEAAAEAMAETATRRRLDRAAAAQEVPW